MIRTRLLICIALLLIPIRPAVCQGIDAKMRAEDTRLGKTVSISEWHIAVGELLRRFTEQAAVPLEIDGLDIASGYDLIVECDRVPVGQMMDALYGLVSTRGGEWKWIREGKAGQYSYLLVEGQGAKQRAERYRILSLRAFFDHIAMVRRFSEMEPTERLKHKREIQSALKLDTEQEANVFLGQKKIWSDAQLFFSILSPEQQQQVMEGAATFPFVADQLPAPLYAQYHASFAAGEHSSLQPDGSLKRDPDPKEFTITAFYPPHPQAGAAPSIWIYYKGSVGVTILGSGYVNRAIRATVWKDWFLPGDSETDPDGERVVPKTTVENPPAQPLVSEDNHPRNTLPPGTLAAHVKQMVVGTAIPLLAILPSNELPIVDKPAGKPVREFLDKIQIGLLEMYKWRSGVLLLNNPDWFLEQEQAVPYRWLRLLDGTKGSPPSLADFAQLSSRIDDLQMQWLGQHRGLRSFQRLGPLLNYAALHPRLMSADGSEVGLDDLPFFKALRYLHPRFQTSQPVRIRLIRSDPVAGQIKPFEFRVEIFDTEKRQWLLSTIQDL